ncbi:MAG TPA: hypothetical protein DCE41_37875 [Cytophagales bacterium]|nr:hypothetical protein [Cytophagales bacterium]HAA18710.1 hypothetical protein [Cytophagales bacterium]HAP61565.1 hypothetical protein [Cytophagales bacterium]
MVEGLKHLVHELTKWGDDQIDMFQQNDFWLERELVQLYKLYFDISDKGVEGAHFEGLPHIHYGNIRINLAYNFSTFGYYPVVNTAHMGNLSAGYDTADALDQLADIIAELKVVDWLNQQGREMDGLRYFTYAFETRIRARLIPLLNYLQEQVLPLATAV